MGVDPDHGKPVRQLVNFEQRFGRCVNVTEKNAAVPLPDGLAVRAGARKGQPRLEPDVGIPSQESLDRITTKNGTTTYCLQSPRSKAQRARTSSSPTSCPANKKLQDVKWQVYGKTNQYDTSYRMGRTAIALSLTDPAAARQRPLPVPALRHQQDRARGGEVQLVPDAEVERVAGPARHDPPGQRAGEVASLHGEDDPAPGPAALQVAHGIGGVGQWEGPVDHHS